MRTLILFTLIVLLSYSTSAQSFNLPNRPFDAPSGSEFADLMWITPRSEHENAIYIEVMSGNIPDFQRIPVPVTFSDTINGTAYQLTFYTLPDYFAIGTNNDYFLIPMTPILAQRICNVLDCILPTRKMVDQIWSAAPLKLHPTTIPPSTEMTTIPIFWQHNRTVWSMREQYIESHPPGTLVAGSKKDVIISNSIYVKVPPERVVIYGWHYPDGSPIQPLNSGHANTYADYSHGIRLILNQIILNGEAKSLKHILQDTVLHTLLSDEGIIKNPFYPITDKPTDHDR